MIRARERDRRLAVLEQVAERRAKAENGLDWTLFDPEQLIASRSVLELAVGQAPVGPGYRFRRPGQSSDRSPFGRASASHQLCAS